MQSLGNNFVSFNETSNENMKYTWHEEAGNKLDASISSNIKFIKRLDFVRGSYGLTQMRLIQDGKDRK